MLPEHLKDTNSFSMTDQFDPVKTGVFREPGGGVFSPRFIPSVVNLGC